MSDGKNTYIIAGAIIVAGLLIAFGIFATGKKTSDPEVSNNGEVVLPDIEMPEVTSEDYIIGDTDAKVVVVEYSDIECPFCQRFHTTMNSVISQYDGATVAWAYRHFPLDSLHPDARRYANASECVGSLGGNEAFWGFINALYAEEPSAQNSLDTSELAALAGANGVSAEEFTTCQENDEFADTVQAEYNDARTAGGNGTPYNIFVTSTGHLVPIGGALPEDIMVRIIDSLIESVDNNDDYETTLQKIAILLQ